MKRMGNEEMGHYHTVLFDVDGTLLDFKAAEKSGIDVVMQQYGVCPTEELRRQYRAINDRLWREYEEGSIDRQYIMDTRFAEFFQNLGKTVNGAEAEKLYRKQLDRSAVLIDNAIEICACLSAGHALYVVTNGVSQTQHRRIKDSGLAPYFKGIFVSEDAGSQKPQKEFFEYCFSRMPDEDRTHMLIVGDALASDIKGGNNAGIDTCWYNPGQIKPDVDVRIDYEITDLLELKGIVG